MQLTWEMPLKHTALFSALWRLRNNFAGYATCRRQERATQHAAVKNGPGRRPFESPPAGVDDGPSPASTQDATSTTHVSEHCTHSMANIGIATDAASTVVDPSVGRRRHTTSTHHGRRRVVPLCSVDDLRNTHSDVHALPFNGDRYSVVFFIALL